jgi:hypothetical protein
MAFDHRAIDGALAADLLADIAEELQDFRRRSAARTGAGAGDRAAGPAEEGTVR